MPDEKQLIVPFAELTKSLAERFEVTPQEMINTVKMQCFPGGACSDGQLMMLLSFAKQYDLNPLARECYAFVSKDGRMQVGIQVDGWTKVANRQETFDGQEMEYERSKDGELIAITSKTYVKNRKFPTIYRAVMKEWNRGKSSDVWKEMPEHQLFVKARNEGIRFAFGVSAYDPDDLERIAAAQGTTIEVKAEPTKQIEKSEAAIADANDDATANPPEQADGAGTTAAASRERGASSNANADEQPRDDAPAQTDSPARARLDALIAKKVTAARLNLLLGQAGVEKVEDLSNEQVANLIVRLEKK